MFCRHCGAEMGSYRFCPNCGKDSRESEQPKSEPASSAPKYEDIGGGYSNQYHGPGGKYVNKFVFAILAILLGSLGIHRFYSGKIISGVLYILFCWTGIPGILGLIEGILALFREDDGRGNIFVDPNKFFI